jgi:hypothetical protein
MRTASELVTGAAYLLSTAVTVWLPCWGFRTKYELDHSLDRTDQYIRWSIVALSLVLADSFLLPKGYWSGASVLVFLGFFAWPNLTFYVTRPFRRRKISQEPE